MDSHTTGSQGERALIRWCYVELREVHPGLPILSVLRGAAHARAPLHLFAQEMDDEPLNMSASADQELEPCRLC